MKNIFLLSVILFVGCFSKSEEIKIEGVLLYNYKLYGASYWPSGVSFINQKGEIFDFFSMKDFTQNQILYYCEGDWDAQFRSNMEKDPILSLPYYQENLYYDSSRYHKGGDLYYGSKSDTSHIVIAFSIEGYGIQYDNVCNEFLETYNSIPDCPIQIKIKLPLKILTRLSKAKSLSNEQIRSLGLKIRENDKFLLNRCE